LTNIKTQKNRSFKKTKIVRIVYGEYAFISLNESKMELNNLSVLKKNIKKLIKRKKKKKHRKHRNKYRTPIKNNENKKKKQRNFKV